MAQCKFLIGDEPGNFACGKYDEIVGQPGAENSPAFGAGCSSTLGNEARTRVLLGRRAPASDGVEMEAP